MFKIFLEYLTRSTNEWFNELSQESIDLILQGPNLNIF